MPFSPPLRTSFCYRGLFLSALAFVGSGVPALADDDVPEIVITAYRGVETTIARAGSAVAIVKADDIKRSGAKTVAEVLRRVAGVSFTTSGGTGSATSVRIRGAEDRHTMVLIDGVPVNDPSSATESFDFSGITLDNVERIEVLRGPQSAVYGSDAIGGVINIITTRPGKGVRGSASAEFGSYRTGHGQFSVSAADGPVAFAASGSLLTTEGFSRQKGNKEKDGTIKASGSARFEWRPNDVLSFEASVNAYRTWSEYDVLPNDPSGVQKKELVNGRLSAKAATFDNRWHHTVNLFVTDSVRHYATSFGANQFDGTRIGSDYQGVVEAGLFGRFIYGGLFETEEVDTSNNGVPGFGSRESHVGLFAMHQFSVGERLHLSASARWDDYENQDDFVTGRATAAFEIFETETRLHASVGTGAKVPSLYQRFAPIYGTPTLQPEESIGGDVGITQTLFDGRLTVDVTGFYNQFENLISFDFATFTYQNTSKAETRGIEVTANARLVPGVLDAEANYTYLQAEDTATGLALARRPEHEGRLALIYTGIDDLRLEVAAAYVGDRFNFNGEVGPLDPYWRVDLFANYQAGENVELFGRIENLFDADYEEVLGYNTPGLSAYAGIKATY